MWLVCTMSFCSSQMPECHTVVAALSKLADPATNDAVARFFHADPNVPSSGPNCSLKFAQNS